MTDTRLWDRAALAIAIDGRRLPAVASLPLGDPTVADLFEFMRDAELRFATLRMRILDRSVTARGEDETEIDVMLRHAGHARVTTSPAGRIVGGHYEVWISNGDIVRTYSAEHRLGTQRPIRNRPRGLDDPDLPGMSRVYEPVTGLPMETLPDTFVHPAGYCQNVLSTGRCTILGDGPVAGRSGIRLRCEHPRTIEMPADRPDHRIDITVDRETGLILSLSETIGDTITRAADVVDLTIDASLPPNAFDFVFPTGTTMLY